MDASVKVMRSYDYCHFEISLSIDETTLEEADNLRKAAARLTDKAVHQYKIAKREAENMIHGGNKLKLEKETKIIRENFPKSEWTPEQQAKIKALEDFEYYDYQDDWDNYWD